MTYTFTDHLHNFAVWTAARAVQRKFTSTENINSAINETELKGLIVRKDIITNEQFDKFHLETANQIIKCFERIDKKLVGKATYGRAAKIIAIYIKTAIVIRDSGLSQLAKIAHPPIDSILLARLQKDNNDLISKRIKWTQLKEEPYFNLIENLRTLHLEYFWELERYWTPIQKEEGS